MFYLVVFLPQGASGLGSLVRRGTMSLMVTGLLLDSMQRISEPSETATNLTQSKAAEPTEWHSKHV